MVEWLMVLEEICQAGDSHDAWYYIIHQIPKLKFLDSTPVKSSEKSEAKRIGVYMKVARPKVEVAHEASDETADSRYSPLPSNNQKEGTHR
ncbi:leucine-rich repeat-containing protein, partial [Nephila pilipes]